MSDKTVSVNSFC